MARLTRADFRRAIAESDGTYVDIARRLGIDPGTLLTYRRQRAYVQDLCDRKREQMNRPPSLGLDPVDVQRAIDRAAGSIYRAARYLQRTPRAVYYFLDRCPDAARYWRTNYR